MYPFNIPTFIASIPESDPESVSVSESLSVSTSSSSYNKFQKSSHTLQVPMCSLLSIAFFNINSDGFFGSHASQLSYAIFILTNLY